MKLDEAQIESSGAIGVVEKYHASLRLACERIQMDTDLQASVRECLELSVFEANCTIGPEGICSILLHPDTSINVTNIIQVRLFSSVTHTLMSPTLFRYGN